MKRGQPEEEWSDAAIILGLMDAWEFDTEVFLDQAAHAIREDRISIWVVIKYFDLLGGEQSALRQRLRRGGAPV